MEVSLCGAEHTDFKSFMDYRKITNEASAQYQLIYSDSIIIGDDGLLYSGEHIGIAMGSRYGEIGDKFIITLDTGKQFKAIKLDEKDDSHTYNGCHHRTDGSVVEFVIDKDKAANSYSRAILMGDFNEVDAFNGTVIRIQKVVE